MVTLQPHTGLPRRAVGEGKPLRSRVKVVLAVVLFFFFFFLETTWIRGMDYTDLWTDSG